MVLHVFLQELPVFLEPSLGSLRRRHPRSNNIPKARSMVRLHQVCEFMNDHVIDHKHRGFD